jgi:hypothetical protein
VNEYKVFVYSFDMINDIKLRKYFFIYREQRLWTLYLCDSECIYNLWVLFFCEEEGMNFNFVPIVLMKDKYYLQCINEG